ncbi:MAG: histidine phosphatase family protein, partial [Halobacteriales archaeon]
GETDWNRVDRIQGWGDISLNARGRTQARAAAQYLADRYPDLDRLLSSDLPRAIETANAVALREAFEHLEIEYEPLWRERDFGIHQGQEGDQFFEENPEFAMLDGHDNAKQNVPEGGESYVEFRERVHSAWADLVAEVEGTVLVVTHSGVIRAIIAAIEDAIIEDVFYEYDVENGSITEVVADGEPRLEGVNHIGHLSSSQ